VASKDAGLTRAHIWAPARSTGPPAAPAAPVGDLQLEHSRTVKSDKAVAALGSFGIEAEDPGVIIEGQGALSHPA
jgi:hypothetical protein